VRNITFIAVILLVTGMTGFAQEISTNRPARKPHLLTEYNLPGLDKKVSLDLIEPMDETRKMIICDPQTSGGLLMAVEPDSILEFMTIVENENAFVKEIGHLMPRTDQKEFICFKQ